MIQYLWEYCKTHFTKRKTKHIVETQTQKYRNIIKEIQHGTFTNNVQNESLFTTATDYISEKDKTQMIKELTQFLHAETDDNQFTEETPSVVSSGIAQSSKYKNTFV
jgi:hypothetical protein